MLVLGVLLQLYCNGGQQKQQLGARRYFPVTLGQCANIAYGLCQERAMNGWMSPCGYAFRGHKQCSKDNFMSFYTGDCPVAAAAVVTSSWAKSASLL